MGIKERRLREKQLVKEKILEAVNEMIATEGWSAVSIRKIADKVEYSAPMIYEYFANKEAILLEFQLLWINGMTEKFKDLQNKNVPKEEILDEIVTLYFEYACENKELYKIAMGFEGISNISPKMEEAIAMARNVLKSLLMPLSIKNQEDLLDQIRGVLHGILSIVLTNKIAGGEQRGKQLAKQALLAISKA